MGAQIVRQISANRAGAKAAMGRIFAAWREMNLDLVEIGLLVVIVISGAIATAICVIMAISVHPLVWLVAPLPLVIAVFLICKVP